MALLQAAWRTVSKRLLDSLPVEARWVPASLGDEPILCWPRPSAADPRRPLSLEMLVTLKRLALRRQPRVDGANLEVDWMASTPPRRQVRAKLVIASPEPEAHVRALANAVALQARTAGSLIQAGLELTLDGHHVNDAAALAPAHSWRVPRPGPALRAATA